MKEGYRMNQIIDLNIEFERNNTLQAIHPIILKDDKHLVLVDTAYPDFLTHIENALLKHHINPIDLTHIFITHHDIDHIGALRRMKDKYPHIKIVSTEAESDYISGKKKSLRLEKMEEMLKDAPLDQKPMYQAFCDRLKAIEKVEVDIKIQYGDILPWLGGTKILLTPGHMPNHASLYVIHEKVVITGDAASVQQGVIQTVSPQFTLNMDDAKKSLDFILSLDAERYFCFHGGLYFKK